MVIPGKNTDTLEFCQLLNTQRRFYKKEKATVYSPRLLSFLPQLNKSEFAARKNKKV
jgi:hypothetical protein